MKREKESDLVQLWKEKQEADRYALDRKMEIKAKQYEETNDARRQELALERDKLELQKAQFQFEKEERQNKFQLEKEERQTQIATQKAMLELLLKKM